MALIADLEPCWYLPLECEDLLAVGWLSPNTGFVHYVAAHRYLPPQIFIDAVLACPAMNSMDYKRALLANGGRSLVKAGMLDAYENTIYREPARTGPGNAMDAGVARSTLALKGR
ncbi:hypothetical protein [Pseudoduganella violaceinigra]|uniref:hypothetical protein n=1 Tax=Pseudoduganella violaceinigra TaxID=246602 RepID=UPI0012B57A22|nr:hypothetical protein [Pseudoduganella violaceinigra]